MTKYLILTKYEKVGELEPRTKIEISLGLATWYQVDRTINKLADILGFHKVPDALYMLTGYWTSDDGMTILEVVSRDARKG